MATTIIGTITVQYIVMVQAFPDRFIFRTSTIIIIKNTLDTISYQSNRILNI